MTTAAHAEPPAAPDWELKWSDEFDTEGAPDAARWTFEEGFVRNNEAQLYTRRPENVRIEGGMLVIEGRREEAPNPRYKPGSDDWQEAEKALYTSASLKTQGLASWKFGRIEVRAKLPQGRGVWPAIWTLGDAGGWPQDGEIDIMEFVGKEPNHVHGTVHFAGPDGKHQSNGQAHAVERPFDGFHTYAVEWFADRIDWFFDDVKFHTFALDQLGAGEDNPFRKPHYLLLNLALGGAWGGDIDDGVLPQRYLIDYVRVYEAKPAP